MRVRFGNSTVRRIVLGISAAVLAFAALASWAISSPVGSSPDDDYHLVSIWCGAGERDGICERVDDPKSPDESRLVPSTIFLDAVCYVRKPAQSAACQGDMDQAQLVERARGNFEGDYPPVFYAVMSVFVSGNVEASVVAMRLFNAALFVAFVSVLTWLTPPGRRGVVVAPVVVTAVPLGMFIIASVNPSSWALLSAATFWIALYNFFEATGRRRWVFAGLAALALLMGAGARADAAAYAGLAIVGVLILQARRTRSFALSMIVPAMFIVVAVLFYRSSGQSSAAGAGMDSVSSGGFARELFQAFIQIPDMWAGMLGRWGLGWLDTGMPALVWVSSLAVFAAVIFFGLGRPGVRKYLATGLMFAAFWGVPTLLQAQAHAPVGLYIQPRYILPIAIMLVGFALLATRDRGVELAPAQLVVIVLALTAANALALHVNTRRYVTGQDAGGLNLDHGAEWWWNVGPSPMVSWLIGSLAFGFCLALLGYLEIRDRDASVTVPGSKPAVAALG